MGMGCFIGSWEAVAEGGWLLFEISVVMRYDVI